MIRQKAGNALSFTCAILYADPPGSAFAACCSFCPDVPVREAQFVYFYFLLIDRFASGNPDNNTQTASGMASGSAESTCDGGELAGLIEKLAYIMRDIPAPIPQAKHLKPPGQKDRKLI